MSQGRGHLDLETSHIANSKPSMGRKSLKDGLVGLKDLLPKDATDSHQEPEVVAVQLIKVGHHRQLSEEDHEREEESAGVDIVVEGEGPDVAIHSWHHFLGVDGEQRHKQGGHHSIHSTWEETNQKTVLI